MLSPLQLYQSVDARAKTQLNRLGGQLGLLHSHNKVDGYPELHERGGDAEIVLRDQQRVCKGKAVKLSELITEHAREELLLTKTCALGAGHLELAGDNTARAMLEDDDDLPSLVGQLVVLVHRLPHVGAGLAALLTERKKAFTTTEGSLKKATDELTAAVRAYNNALAVATGTAVTIQAAIDNAGLTPKRPARRSPRKKLPTQSTPPRTEPAAVASLAPLAVASTNDDAEIAA